MTRAHLETVDALMAQYAAGILPEPARVLVAAHLEMRPASREKVVGFEVAAGALIDRIDPMPLSNRAETLSAIFHAPEPLSPRRAEAPSAAERDRLFPRAIADFVGFEAEDIPWRTKLPGFKEHIVGKVDGCEVSFFWIRPGRTVPGHTHEGLELSLVLDGAFSDGRGRYGKGDISLANDSVDHRPVAEKSGPCIGFAVLDAPLKLTGSLRQLLGDLIG